MKTYKAISLLMCYPCRDVQVHIDDLEDALIEEGALKGRPLKKLLGFIDIIRKRPLLDLQADYVELFDRGRAHSLHIFEHVHGESRMRGSAMVDLSNLYAASGFEVEGGELPDFLPLFLEFLSTREPAVAQEMLRDIQHITEVIGTKLKKRASPWTALFDALNSLADNKLRPEVLAKALEGSAKEITTLEELDREWEDTPAFDGDPMDACSTCNLSNASLSVEKMNAPLQSTPGGHHE